MDKENTREKRESEMNLKQFWMELKSWCQWSNTGCRVLIKGVCLTVVSALTEIIFDLDMKSRFILLTIMLFTFLPSLGFAACSFWSHFKHRILIWFTIGLVLMPTNRVNSEPAKKDNVILLTVVACVVPTVTAYVIIRTYCWWNDIPFEMPTKDNNEKQRRDEKRLLGNVNVSGEPLESVKQCGCTGLATDTPSGDPSVVEFQFTEVNGVASFGPVKKLGAAEIMANPLPEFPDSNVFSRNGITVMSGAGTQRVMRVDISPNLKDWFPLYSFPVDDGKPVTIRDSFPSGRQAFYRVVNRLPEK